MEMRRCPYCGSELDVEDTTCPFCGAHVGRAEAKAKGPSKPTYQSGVKAPASSEWVEEWKRKTLRNRIIAGLSDAILAVEARRKSGTLITVGCALDQGKEVYSIPGRLTDKLSEGCNGLIAIGARIALSPKEMADDIKKTAFEETAETAEYMDFFVQKKKTDDFEVIGNDEKDIRELNLESVGQRMKKINKYKQATLFDKKAREADISSEDAKKVFLATDVSATAIEEIAEKTGFAGVVPVSGQTYSRKLDFKVLAVLSGIAQSAAKFSSDLRLLQHMKEVEEPFEKNQIGSSAMAYKRNPMRSERIASLARYVIVDALNPAVTASAQWFERTLDDSANKRISVPEAFLAVDAILELYINVVSGLVVYPKMIERHLLAELPFMATENIMMEAVKNGGDRQELHEKIRRHSMEAGKVVKVQGGENDLIERIAADETFGMSREEILALIDPKAFVGRSPEQVEEFVESAVKPVLDRYGDLLGIEVEIKV